MKTKATITSRLIAPCGMNCGVCIGHLRDKNRCLGCREMSEGKPESCRKCTIMNCKIRSDKEMPFCSDKCEEFPCTRLKNLDKRYKAKYKMSMLENLENIKKFGVAKFVESEKKRWKCTRCGGLVSVHRDCCLECGEKR